ncbi:MAG TPA: hypothetical protein VED45_12395 [Steroidobacteraceae bacterium]|nr:hypothetical protein [Steroidobacteraceae bacterium]
MEGRRSDAAHWRDELRRDITGLMLLKLAALALLWGLFFSPAHRTVVSADGASRRLSLAPGQPVHSAQLPSPRDAPQAAPGSGETE